MMEYPICDACGSEMTDFDGCAWYTCPNCGNSVRIIDGCVTWEREIFGSKSNKEIPPERWRDFEDGTWHPDDDE